MAGFSRRSVLATGAAAAGLAALPSGWVSRPVEAAPGTKVRYSAYSPKGKEMLKIYADGVAAMRKLPTTDPRSWVFQWYTHFIPGVNFTPGPGSKPGPQNLTTKQPEILRVFGISPSPAKQLAEAMWSECQSHLKSQDAMMFLPWHRMYVLCFEQIVATMAKAPDFTLPYWDYMNPAEAAIPPEFRDPSSPLYIPNRNKFKLPDGSWYDVNGGSPINEDTSDGPLSLDCMATPSYQNQGSDTGFCNALNQNPHGYVHDYVGADNNMGYVPTAANDPIFWLHHCNVDRIWASWNANGGVNPPQQQPPTGGWETRTFTFVNGQGQRVVYNAAEVSAIAPLGYSFETLYGPEYGPKQPPKPLMMAVAKEKATVPTALAALGSKLTLGENRQRVTLLNTTLPGKQKEAALPLAAIVRNATSLPSGQRAVLRITNLTAEGPVGGLFHIYLGLPEGAQPERKDPRFVGSLSFFTAHPASHHEGNTHDAVPLGTPDGSIDFDVTDQLAALSRSGAVGLPTVSFIPFGNIRPEAKPTIGNITLIIN